MTRLQQQIKMYTTYLHIYTDIFKLVTFSQCSSSSTSWYFMSESTNTAHCRVWEDGKKRLKWNNRLGILLVELFSHPVTQTHSWRLSPCFCLQLMTSNHWKGSSWLFSSRTSDRMTDEKQRDSFWVCALGCQPPNTRNICFGKVAFNRTQHEPQGGRRRQTDSPLWFMSVLVWRYWNFNGIWWERERSWPCVAVLLVTKCSFCSFQDIFLFFSFVPTVFLSQPLTSA